MADNGINDVNDAETVSSDVPVTGQVDSLKRPISPYARINRSITLDELNDDGAKKLVLAKIDDLELSVYEYKIKLKELEKELKGKNSEWEELFKNNCLLKANQMNNVVNEIAFFTLNTVGSAFVGLIFSEKINGWSVGITGVLMLIASIVIKICKFSKKRNE